jgi:hypothetical protein
MCCASPRTGSRGFCDYLARHRPACIKDTQVTAQDNACESVLAGGYCLA